MSKWEKLWEKTKRTSATAASKAVDSTAKFIDHADKNKDSWLEKSSEYGKQLREFTTEFLEEGGSKGKEQLKGFYVQARYSKGKLKELEHRVESQGAMYRELLRNKSVMDSVFLGGESAASLLIAASIPPDIEAAYAAAFPAMSEEISFQEKLQTLDGDTEVTGFLSTVKGKLFEQKYVDYLNGGMLPEGYSATLAGSANQGGWDIAISGPNDEVVQVLQAKATDSISYVKAALETYPSIDVVTTDEVYSHLVMAGVSDNIANGGISNMDLSDRVESAASSASLDFDFVPPILTLAFIAFTSYRDESLTLYEKAKGAGDRSAKAYFSYLVGGGLATITNTWWLGVLGSVSSRYMSDVGLRKVKLVESLNQAIESNQRIINRLKAHPNVA